MKSYQAVHDPDDPVRVEEVAFAEIERGTSDDDVLKAVRPTPH